MSSLADTSMLAQLNVPSPEYPVKAKQAAASVAGVPTDVSVLKFTDKILVTVSQGGRLGMWLSTPLDPSSPIQSQLLPSSHGSTGQADGDDDLLPLPHLTPQPLLGATSGARQTTGQLIAVQIASSIALRNPEESRSVLVGLGLEREELSREGFVDLVEAVGRCL